MKKRNYRFKEKLYLWPGEGGNWHFLPISKESGQRIREEFATKRDGKRLALVKVEVKINQSVWETSLFYSTISRSYLLPVKAEIRKLEGIQAGEKVSFSIRIK